MTMDVNYYNKKSMTNNSIKALMPSNVSRIFD